jgi:alpha-L-rhamnosidase
MNARVILAVALCWVGPLSSPAPGAEPESRRATDTSTRATPAFPLKLSADRRYLVDQNDQPFLVIGDSPWSIIVEPTPGQVDLYLDDRAAKGFNLALETAADLGPNKPPSPTGALIVPASSGVIQAGWGESGPAPAKLRCEYRENPLGIDAAKPRLSWTFEGRDQKIEDRGQKQSAYQVLVASTEELLRKDKGDLWDSGEVASDQSTQVEYAGKALESRRYCHWKVRVWLAGGDKKGKPTDWSKPALWTMGLLTPADWQAKWIGRDDAQAVVPDDGKNRYLPATHVRKDFTLAKSPQRAVLYVTSLGIAEPHLNGNKVGEDLLIPGWTDYRKRIYYRAYDVTAQVHRGANTLGAILGDGWFRGHLSIIGQNLYGRETRLLAQLHVDYADGSTDTIASDGSWTAGFGPILAADLYAGETYDARLEVSGWDRPGFTNALWRPVELGASVHPSLQAAPGAPVQRTGIIQPVSIKQPKPGLDVVDFGRNFAGWIRLGVSAAAGTRITMRFGEMLNPDGTVYRTNLRGARATDAYICKGSGVEVWEPHFTYHGFQFVEVEGLPARPEPQMFTGIIVGSALPLTGSFACSDETMTRTADNMRCTIRANLIDLPVGA